MVDSKIDVLVLICRIRNVVTDIIFEQHMSHNSRYGWL